MNESFGALGAIVMSLALVALAHPDPSLRATAERLLRIMFGAR
ncbi:hypothetical protein [Streptomyces sp. NPDC059008]